MISEYSLLGLPMTPKEIREIAFEYADKNNLSGFSEDKEIGGYTWFYGNMKCHGKLHVKNSVTNLSLARVLGSSQHIIDQWFDMYQSLLEQLNITDPKYIWNIDEYGSEDMAKVKRVVGIKGIKQYQMQPREKPRQTTMLTYINAAGFALPPFGYPQGEVS